LSPDDSTALPGISGQHLAGIMLRTRADIRLNSLQTVSFTESKTLRMPLFGFATNTEFTPRFFGMASDQDYGHRMSQVLLAGLLI